MGHCQVQINPKKKKNRKFDWIFGDDVEHMKIKISQNIHINPEGNFNISRSLYYLKR